MTDSKTKIKKRLLNGGIEAADFEAAQLCTLPDGELEAAVEKRLSGVPLQYILGEWEFFGLKFYVGDGVLIPRPDTEILVEEALSFLKCHPNAAVADLCSGSGCVAIAIAKNSDARVTAVEKYPAAFGYLLKNAELNSADIKTVNADVLENIDGIFDLIVSNPPYIRSGELDNLSREVKCEPQTALDGGDDGLVFYRRISALAKDALSVGGCIMFEIGYDQKAEVTKILENGGYKNITCRKDYSGNDRVVTAWK